MKRLLSAVCCVLLAANGALAFDTNRRAERIAILSGPTYDRAAESLVQNTVIRTLVDELRGRGFDAFASDATIEDLDRDGSDADYVVEIVGGDANSTEYGGVGVGNRHVGVSLGVVVARVVTDVHIYDGATLERIKTENLFRRSTAVLPTSVGIGGPDLYAIVAVAALPFMERAQYRRVSREVAREAATHVTAAIRGR